jgi:flagellar basal-body rod protein FlgF
MAGAYYIALSGMHARLEALDRLATDLANVSTIGYKAGRTTNTQADRDGFGVTLQAAIDVTNGPTHIDTRAGVIATTGRDLDVAVDGPGLFAIDTPAGTRYTHDGRFVRRADGVLATASGMAVQGDDGKPLAVGLDGVIQFEADGTVRSAGAAVGRLKVTEFNDPGALVREGPDQFRSDDEQPHPAAVPAVRPGALEQSNVSVAERLTELSNVSRNFTTMERALSLLSNDIDLRAITELGRR